jgi:hypothetical protein
MVGELDDDVSLAFIQQALGRQWDLPCRGPFRQAVYLWSISSKPTAL